MNSTQFLALVCCLAVGELVLARRSNLNEWLRYKQQHGKVYETPEEDARRFAIFLAAKDEIEQHNTNNQAPSYKLGLNHLSDRTQEEWAKLNGFRYNATKHLMGVELAKDDDFLRSFLDDPTPEPAEVDWRKVPNRVSQVKNQGDCGACWAFATTGVLEGQQVTTNATRKIVSLSEQDLLDCSDTNFGCDGGDMEDALNDIAQVGGIEKEVDYPYKPSVESVCLFNKTKNVMTDTGAINLPQGEAALKKMVAKFGPVAIAMTVTNPFKAYKSGIFDDPQCTTELDHAVLVVGYGTDPKHGDFWIVKNSWGTSWGENGYFRISRSKQMCKIGQAATIPKFN